MLRIEIETGNSAFDGDARGGECARILVELARRIGDMGACDDGHGGPIYDANGNRVGSWSLSEREEAED